MVSLKNALSLGLRGMAVIVFAVEGENAWMQSMLMADGGMLGGPRGQDCALDESSDGPQDYPGYRVHRLGLLLLEHLWQGSYGSRRRLILGAKWFAYRK